MQARTQVISRKGKGTPINPSFPAERRLRRHGVYAVVVFASAHAVSYDVGMDERDIERSAGGESAGYAVQGEGEGGGVVVFVSLCIGGPQE